MKQIYKKHLPLIEKLVYTTLLFLTMLIIARYQMREFANDPQISIVKNVSFNLESGLKIDELTDVLPKPADGIFTLEPWVILSDSNGETLFNTTTFGSNVPKIPFAYLENAVIQSKYTWSPDGVNQQAIVVSPYTNSKTGEHGYVISGRNLESTNMRILEISIIIGVGYVGAVLLLILFNRIKNVDYSRS